MVAEFRRLALRSGRSPADFLPRELYRIQVTLGAVLDLTDPAAAAVAGLSSASMRADDLSACQAVGDAAHYLGLEGVHAPSAAADGTVVAVFTDKLQSSSQLGPALQGRWDDPPE